MQKSLMLMSGRKKVRYVGATTINRAWHDDSRENSCTFGYFLRNIVVVAGGQLERGSNRMDIEIVGESYRRMVDFIDLEFNAIFQQFPISSFARYCLK